MRDRELPMPAAFYLPFEFPRQAFGIRRYIPTLADEYNIPEGLLLAGNDPIGTLPAGFPLEALCTAAAGDEQDLTVSISDIGDEVIILPIGTAGADTLFRLRSPSRGVCA